MSKIIQRVKEFVLPNERLRAELRVAHTNVAVRGGRIAELEGDLQRVRDELMSAVARYGRGERTLETIFDAVQKHGTLGPTSVYQAYQDAKREQP